MVTIINGSPNKDSKTLKVTTELLKTYNSDINIFNPYQMTIHSCDDCKYCHFVKGCSKQDDMYQIYQSIEKTDILIISSPIYFGHFTDQTMKIINRFQRYFSDKWIQKNTAPKIKQLIIVSSAAHDNEMFKGLDVTISILEKLFSIEHTNRLYIPFSDSFNGISKSLQKQIDEITMGTI